MGRKKKYLTDEARKLAQAAAVKRHREKKKHPKSWMKETVERLDRAGEAKTIEAARPAFVSEDVKISIDPLPTQPGDPAAGDPAPFEGLGSINIPFEPKEDAEQPAQEAKTETDSELPPDIDEKVFDVKNLKAMARDMIEKGVLASGMYAASHGYMALGPFWAKLAGKSAGVLIEKWAPQAGIDDETGSMIVILGVSSFNGVQAFRAYREQEQKKEEAKHGNVAVQQPVAAQQPQQHTNGVARPAGPGAPVPGRIGHGFRQPIV